MYGGVGLAGSRLWLLLVIYISILDIDRKLTEHQAGGFDSFYIKQGMVDGSASKPVKSAKKQVFFLSN